MRLLWSILFGLLFFISCNGEGKSSDERKIKEDPYAETTIDSVSLKEAEHQARIDSIIEATLKADTLRKKHILVDKESFSLFLRENGATLMKVPICLGKGIGQKKRKGDHKTPEGTFKITSIYNSSEWTHDFNDGKGKVKGAYGPWFFRLDTPQSPHIGIHGSCFPETVGTRDSDGCVRLLNEDLEELKKHVFKGMVVIIKPDNPSATVL